MPEDPAIRRVFYKRVGSFHRQAGLPTQGGVIGLPADAIWLANTARASIRAARARAEQKDSSVTAIGARGRSGQSLRHPAMALGALFWPLQKRRLHV